MWATGLLLVALIFAAAIVAFTRHRGPQPAPEADLVQQAQAALPFQALIPAFLPARFDRRNPTLRADLTGPAGEPLFEVVYTDRNGGQLVLHEWVPKVQAAGKEVRFTPVDSQTPRCPCGCPMCAPARSAAAGSVTAANAPNPFQIDRDRLRVLAGVSSPDVVDYFELQMILGTLAPPAGLTVYTTFDEAPQVAAAVDAVVVEPDAAGVQALVLVVTPDGYSPAHFQVQRGAPVRVLFRQFGNVACGNELLIEQGNGQVSHAILNSADDAAVIEFTPEVAGDFEYHCPHYIYRGVMTVM